MYKISTYFCLTFKNKYIHSVRQTYMHPFIDSQLVQGIPPSTPATITTFSVLQPCQCLTSWEWVSSDRNFTPDTISPVVPVKFCQLWIQCQEMAGSTANETPSSKSTPIGKSWCFYDPKFRWSSKWQCFLLRRGSLIELLKITIFNR